VDENLAGWVEKGYDCDFITYNSGGRDNQLQIIHPKNF